jgi:predicted small metal-binding protein
MPCHGLADPGILQGVAGRVPAQEAEMAKHIACVVTGCQFTAQAATEEDILVAVKVHAAKDHGVTEVTPELAAKVKAAIQTR